MVPIPVVGVLVAAMVPMLACGVLVAAMVSASVIIMLLDAQKILDVLSIRYVSSFSIRAAMNS